MPGQFIGRFEILSELGKGGQGAVYLARDPQLDRQVAIKTLRRLGHKTEQLTHEARIVSKLQHPNIIALYDYGEDQGVPYLVYAYVEGKTLAQVLKQEKSLPFARAAEIACDVLRGLSYAHAQGVSHLDMKPANIMIAKSGLAMVMDFGLATTAGNHEQTIGSPLAGTPRYVAPEIVAGQPGGPLSDIYAVGTVLYEMVTGEFAVGGENMFEVLNRAVHEQIAAPSSRNAVVDKTLETIILNALGKTPGDRYPNAASMLQDLEEYLAESHSATMGFLLQRMRNKLDFPAISGVISEINRIVASEDESSNRLTSVILQDFALTNKLLRLVNTAAFNRFGGSINTISKAVAILGFETVRNIAASLMILEFMQNRSQATQLKEEIIKAVLAGELAVQISSGDDIRDVEETLIGALFHNLGKMLAIFYFFEESQEIARLAGTERGEDLAAARILGIPYSELGMNVARNWNFPQRLIAIMRPLPDDPVSPPRNDLERMSVRISLAYELCDIPVSSDPQGLRQRLTDLSMRYKDAVQLSEQDLAGMLKTSLEEIRQRSSALNINTAGSPLLSRMQQWSASLQPAPDTASGTDMDGVTDLGKSVANRFGEDDSLTLPLNPDSILGAGIQDVTNTMIGDYNVNDVLKMVLETIHRGMGFNRTLFMIRNSTQGVMAARFGFGPDIGDLIPHFHFPLRFEADVFHLAIEKGLDISIEDVRSLNILDKIPGWYRNMIDAPSFVLLPLMIGGKPVGLIYGDMLDANQLDISRQQLSLLRTLRNQAVLAIKQKT